MISFFKGLIDQLPGPEVIEACLVMLGVTFLIITNLFFPHKWLDRIVAKKTGFSEHESGVYVERFCDFLFMGLIPGLIMVLTPGISFKSIGLALPAGNWWWWVLGGSGGTLIVLLIRFFGVKPSPLYPEVHERDWTPRRFIRYNLSWVVSLVGYEVLFRGVLFLSLYRAFGFLPAIIVESCFYGLAHYKRGALESFNSTYFSAYLCITVFFSGSVLPGYLTHLAIAIMNTALEVKKNPEMKFVSGKSA